jgi:ribonuclease HI
LISPTGEQLKYVLQIFWKVSNNEAEYEALLHGLRLAVSLGIKQLLVYGDSAVVINQVNKSWDRNKENMDAYCLEVRKLENKFYGLEFHHIVRDNNVAADVLSKLGSTRAQVPTGVFIHELHAPSIPGPAPTNTDPAPSPAGQEVMMLDVDWRQPFIDYIRGQKVPTNTNFAEQIIRQAKSYVLDVEKLYRRGATSGVLMKCVPREEGKDIFEEIHKGVCGNHVSSRTLVSKAFRRAFYWPTALGDAEELIRRCQGCQYFAKQQHVPAYKLVTIPTSCGIRRQQSNTTKASLKTAHELISMDSKKLAAPPSSSQQGTLRVSDAIMIATSRNAPSMLVIKSTDASRTRKNYTSSARHGKVPSRSQRRSDQARIASKHLKATMSATRGMSTSSVDSTRSLSTTLRESKSIRLPPGSLL